MENINCPECNGVIGDYPKDTPFPCPSCKNQLQVEIQVKDVISIRKVWSPKGRLISPFLMGPVVEILKTLNPNPRTLIDLGCGMGWYGLLFRAYFRERTDLRVIGYDSVNDLLFGGVYDEFKQGWLLSKRQADLGYAEKDYPNPVILCLNILDGFEKDIGMRLLHEIGKLGYPLIISVSGLIEPDKKYTDIKGKVFEDRSPKWAIHTLRDTLDSWYKYSRSWVIRDDVFKTENLLVVFENNHPLPTTQEYLLDSGIPVEMVKGSREEWLEQYNDRKKDWDPGWKQ